MIYFRVLCTECSPKSFQPNKNKFYFTNQFQLSMKQFYAFSSACCRLVIFALISAASFLVPINAVAQCSNVTYGGTIGSNQSGNVGFNPSAFLNVTSPSGGSGTMEYMWLYKSSATGWSFQTVSGATSSSYDAPSLNETTTYRRCARRSGCSAWAGETNDCTITITPSTCNNVTNGGTIGSDQAGCTGFDPALLTNVSSPSGGSGSLQIIWMYKSASTNWNLTSIAGATDLTYDPGPVTEDTYFRRCTRRQGCSSYDGESNDIFIDITPCCNATIDQVVIFNLGNGTTSALTNGATYTVASLPASWNIQAIVSGPTAESVKFTFTGSQNSNNVQNDVPFATPGDTDPLNLAAGTYTLNVKLFSQNDAVGLLCDEEIFTFTIVACDNVTNAGQIGSDQSGCRGFDPAPFTDTTSPSGGSGALEYMWLYKSAFTNNTFQTVVGANQSTYDAGATFLTTTYRRCVRRVGCTSWSAESNDVVVTITGDCTPTEVCDLSGYASATGRILWIPNYGTDFKASLSNGGLYFAKFANGSAHMYGVVERISNPNQKFAVDVWFVKKSTYAEWTAAGLQAKDPELGNPATWTYYNWATNINNTLIGQGTLAGVTLNLTNQNPIYGLQLGDGANALNTNANGFSVWFSYTGTMSGTGDFNATYNCGPQCAIDVQAGPDRQLCPPQTVTMTATVTGAANCSTPGVSDCNHVLSSSGGWLESPSNSTVCGDNAGTKLWTQSGQGTSYIILDLGTTVPAGTQVCANMKLEHCSNSNTSTSNAKIQASTSATTGFVNLTSSVLFSQTSYQDFCYTLAAPARYIKISDNGNCAFRVDYVTYTTASTNAGGVTYAWSGPGIVGATNGASITANAAGTYIVNVTGCNNCLDSDTVVVTSDNIPPVFNPGQQSIYDLGCTQSVPLIQPVATDNNGTVTYSYVDIATCNTTNNSCDYKTYTQGGWGAPAHGNNPGVYRNANFAAAFPTGLTIGCSTGFTLRLTTAQAVQDFLPSGSTPSALPSNQVNPGNSYRNVLAGQLVALTLSLRFDQYDANFGGSNGYLGDQTIASGTFAGMTITQVVAIANQVIGGCSTAYSFSSVNQVLSSLNENFDGGSNHGFVNCSQPDIACACTHHRRWTATDGCGNTATFDQYFITGDNEGPVASSQPSNVTVQCIANVPAAPVVTFTDACQTVVETWMIENSSTENCITTILRTWFATDGCNSTYVYQTITVHDTINPTFNNLPVASAVQCGMLPTSFNVTGSDNCDTSVDITQNYVDSGTGCNLTRTFTFTATDDCGNSITATRVFSIYDNTPPVLTGVPGNSTVQCDAVPMAGGVTASDNCDGNLPVTYSQTSTQGCPYTITRTWSATDNCGNTTSATQVITVVDTHAPVLYGIPADVTIQCDQMPAAFNVWYTDNCANDLIISLTANTITHDCGATFIRTWTVTDHCGNTTSSTQTITVVDTVDPVASNVPQDINLECDAAMPTNVPTFTDNCDLELTILPASSISNDDCYTIIHQSWTATDDCGNSTTVSRNINIVDTTLPYVIQSVPSELTLECDQDEPYYMPTFGDNCDTDLSLSAISGINNVSNCGWDVERAWTATDDCGNSRTVYQVIHFVDTTNPVLVGVPASNTVECDNVPAPANVTATDNCSDASVSLSQSMTQGCPYTITRIWTATDACGNQSSATQTLTVVDTMAPSLIGVPADATVECSAIPAAAIVTATDNCDLTLSVSYNQQYVAVDACQYMLVRTWSVVDDCNNVASASQVLTVVDTTNPTLVNVPADITVECDAIPAHAMVVGDDNCDENVEVSFSQSMTDGCPYTITRTWVGTDNCGNQVTGTQVISVIDTTYPVLHGVPASITLECDQPAPLAVVTATDNCTDDLVVTLNATTVAYDCGSIFTRIWSVTDACGNTTSATQVITYVDTTMPYVIQGVPAELTLECDQDEPYYMPTFGDNCDTELSLSAISGINNVSNCGWDVERAWIATDDCGNSRTVYQVIHFVDTTNPVLVGVPASTTVECDNVPAPANVTATDNCSDASVSLSQSMTQGCPYTITRIWTATDACGNQSSATQTLLVVDTTLPYIISSPPIHLTVQCGDEIALVAPVFGDNCDDDLTLGYTEEITSGGCVPGLIRIWSATDNCNNTAYFEQIISIIDTLAPTFDNLPSDATVECDAVPAAAIVTASDICDEDVTVTFSQTSTTGCPYTITRTWTAMDECENTTVGVQVITVVDTTYPVLHGVPASLTLECDQPAPGYNVTATDNCAANMQINFTANLVTMDCGSTLTRTWSVSDDCGNTTSASQIINFVDTRNPYVILGVPSELTLQCDQPEPIYMPTFGDNCDQGLSLTAISGITNVNDCGWDVERAWTATDDCGNSTTVTQIIHFIDTTNPVLVGTPASTTVECDAVPAPALVSATDNCSEATVSFSQSMTEGCPYTITRTWVATDVCGNESSYVQTILVVDTTSPSLIGVPGDATVECSNIPAAAIVTAIDNCDLTLTVSYNQQNININACSYMLVRTWSVTDDCNNMTSASQILTVTDTTNPTLNNVPADAIVECDEVPAAAVVTGSDNCDNNVEVSFNQSATEGCPYTITRTWVGVDNCGNQVSATQVLTVVDTTYPVLHGVPASITLECDQPTPGYNVTASDNCAQDMLINFTANVVTMNCGSVLTRTWSVSDDCGNTTSATQVINFVDTTNPYVILGVPAELTLECDQDEPVYTPTFGDNCDQELSLTAISGINNVNDCGWDVERAWTATDDCGNSTTVTQVIHFVDTTNPVLVGVPTNSTVECSAIPAPSNVTATDNCSDATVSLSQSIGEGCPYTITRTWTATDACGNQTTATQTLQVVDTTAPSLIGVPADATVECSNIPAAAIVTATDNCDQTLEIGYYEQFIPGDACQYILVRTWSVTDNCDNTTSASQILTVTDTTNPTLNNVPANATVECDEVPVATIVTGSDNCDDNVEVSFNQSATEGCPYTITRTWVGVDNCGNQVSATQVLTVIDTTYPVLHGVPASTTLECNQPTPVAVVTATDNCADNMLISLTANTVTMDCGSVLTRTWSVSDDCGNTTTASQVINFVDTTIPFIIEGVPTELTVECSSPVPAYTPTFGDNCDNELTVVASSGITNVNECGHDIERSWTATDDCGNYFTVYQVIHIVDTTNPVLVGIPANTTVECSAIPAPAIVTATDNCSDATVSLSQSMTEGCPYTITRTWTATDACGNHSTATQTLQVVDTTNPYLVNNPPITYNIECGEVVPQNDPIFADNCDLNLTITFNEIETSGSCPGALIRTWVATDDCGNHATFEQYVFIHDTTAPSVVVGVPAVLTLECDLPLPTNAPEFMDVCDSEFVVVATTTTMNATACSYDVVRTWVATDYCENSTTVTQTIHVVDTTDPIISSWPADQTYECGETIPGPGEIVYSDNCDTDIEVNYSQVQFDLDCGYYLIRTWRVTDNCGNEAVESQIIYVLDETNPVLFGVPADITIECDQPIPAFATFTATDNCDNDLTLSVNDVIVQNDCGYMIKRYYTAVDDCGNTSSIPQIITVVDTTPPVIVAPADVTVPCNQIPNAPELSATDNCDNNVTVVYNEVIESGCPYSIIRTWTATDDCDNQTLVTQVISVYDEIAPVFDAFPPFVLIECDQIDVYTLTATDNCDVNVTVTIIEEMQVSGGCYGNLLRTYEAVDNCGNSVTAFQIIEIVDTNAPILHNIPAETTVICGQSLPAVPSNIFATDNCSSDMIIAYTQTQTNEFCPYDVIRTWSVSDICGNVTTQTQTIHVTVEVPANVNLLAYPNPAQQHFTLKFSVPTDQEVFGAIYDVTGRQVMPIYNGKADGGRLYQWDIDARNFDAGSYMIGLKVGGEMHHERLIISGR